MRFSPQLTSPIKGDGFERRFLQDTLIKGCKNNRGGEELAHL